jgi:hypothetical protein
MGTPVCILSHPRQMNDVLYHVLKCFASLSRSSAQEGRLLFAYYARFNTLHCGEFIQTIDGT